MSDSPMPVIPETARSGFSLVELSIVLVILGLLTGGILGGQSLIKAAELRSIGKEYEQWTMAVNTFKNKYRAVPGDMRNATSFWSNTWNGDGNGYPDDSESAGAQGEIFTFWQHLALAGMIAGEFTGQAGPGGSGPFFMDSYPGQNVPASKFSGAGWSVYYILAGEAYTTDWYDMEYGNIFEVGGKIPGYEMGDPVFSPEDAWNIDTKFDDGKPGQGMIIARYWNNLCAAPDSGPASATNFDASYRLSDSAARCALAFRRAF